MIDGGFRRGLDVFMHPYKFYKASDATALETMDMIFEMFGCMLDTSNRNREGPSIGTMRQPPRFANRHYTQWDRRVVGFHRGDNDADEAAIEAIEAGTHADLVLLYHSHSVVGTAFEAAMDKLHEREQAGEVEVIDWESYLYQGA